MPAVAFPPIEEGGVVILDFTEFLRNLNDLFNNFRIILFGETLKTFYSFYFSRTIFYVLWLFVHRLLQHEDIVAKTMFNLTTTYHMSIVIPSLIHTIFSIGTEGWMKNTLLYFVLISLFFQSTATASLFYNVYFSIYSVCVQCVIFGYFGRATLFKLSETFVFSSTMLMSFYDMLFNNEFSVCYNCLVLVLVCVVYDIICDVSKYTCVYDTISFLLTPSLVEKYVQSIVDNYTNKIDKNKESYTPQSRMFKCCTNGKSPSSTLARQECPQAGSAEPVVKQVKKPVSEVDSDTAIDGEETRLMARMRKFVSRIAWNISNNHTMFTYPSHRHDYVDRKEIVEDVDEAKELVKRAKLKAPLEDHTLDVTFFKSSHFDGRYVVPWLRQLRFDGVVPILINIAARKKITTAKKTYRITANYTTPEMGEYIKTIRTLIADINYYGDLWVKEENLLDRIRHILLDVYEEMPLPAFTKVVKKTSPIRHHIFCDHPQLRIKFFDDDDFLPTVFKRKNVPPLVTRGSEPNFLFNIVSLLDSKNKFLCPKTIKCIVKTMIRLGLSEEHVITNIRKKLFSWNVKEDPYKMDPQKRMNWVIKMSWFVPYVDPEVFYLNFSDNKKILDRFITQIDNLKNLILQFTRQQYAYHSMSRVEKLNYAKAQSKRFCRVMCTPEVQSLISSGLPLEDVHDYVYKTHYAEIYGIDADNEVMDNVLKKKKTTRSKTIAYNRDVKYAFVSEFHNDDHFIEQSGVSDAFKFEDGAHSFTTYIPYILSVVSVVMWFILYLLPILVKKLWNVVFEYLLPYLCIRWFKQIKVDNILTSYVKLKLIEIKSLIMILMSVTSGRHELIPTEISNLAITSSDRIINLLTTTAHVVKRKFIPTRIVHNVNGQEYQMSAHEWQSYCNAINRGDFDIANNILRQTQQVEQSEMLDRLRQFCEIFFGDITTRVFGIEKLSNFDLQRANAQFAYINHVSRAAQTYRTAFISAISFISRVLFCYDPFNIEYSKYAIEISSLCALSKQLDSKQLKEPTIEYITKVSDLLERMNSSYENPRRAELMPFFVSEFTTCRNKVKDFHDILVTRNSASQTRREPLSVIFTGKPKRGKTTLMNMMISAICSNAYGRYSPAMKYAYNCFSEYHDTYFGQKVTTIDDLFSQNDPDSRRCVAATIINMVNTNPCPLNVAECSSKGKLYWTSDWLMSTTNIANEGIKEVCWNVGLQDPSALDRRMHIALHFEDEFKGLVNEVKIRIDRNTFMPKYEGLSLTYLQVVKMLLLSKQVQDKQYDATHNVNHDFDMSKIQLPFDDMLDMPEVTTTIVTDEPISSYFDWFPSFSYNKFMSTPMPERIEVPKSDNFIREETSYTGESVSSDAFLIGKFFQHFDHVYYVLKIHEYYKRWIGFCVCICLVAFAFLSWYIIKLIPDTKIQSLDAKMTKVNLTHVKKKIINSKLKSTKAAVEPQSSDINVMQALRSIAMDSVMIVFHDKDSDMYYSSHGFVAKDGLLVTTAHCFHDVRSEDIDVRVFRYTGTVDDYNQRTYDISNIIRDNGSVSFENDDVAYTQLPKTMQLPASMYKRLYSIDEAINIPIGTNLYVVSFDHTRSDNLRIRTVTFMDVVKDTTYGTNATYILDYALRYTSCDTKRGDSGSMVFILDGNVLRLIGLHVAGGSQKTGLAVPIYKEHIDFVLNEHDKLQQQSCEMSVPLIPDRSVPLNMSYVPPRRNTIVRTSIYGKLGKPTQKPTHLAPFEGGNGEIIDPMYKACGKIHQQEKIVQRISPLFSDWILGLYGKKQNPRVYSIEESLNVSLNGSSSINRSSSAGYPYCLSGVKGKYGLTTCQETEYDRMLLCTPQFKEELEKYHDELKAGRNIEVIYAMCLKSETRPIDKVDSGKTRLFSICPAHYLILMRMYFLDFIDHVQKKCETHPISVGINAHSLQWTRLYARLSRFNNILSGDFRNFDGGLAKSLIKDMVDIVNKWYDDGPVNARIRELLFEHIYNAHLIYMNLVYISGGGNPSGNPFTSILNSLVNCAMVFTILVEVFGYKTNEFELAVYGDDNVISLIDHRISMKDVSEQMFKLFKMEYTHWSKDSSLEHVDSLESIRYLGRQFVGNHVKLAPLDIDVIINSVYWYRKCASSLYVPTMLSTIRSYAIELSHFPKDMFLEYIEKLKNVLREDEPIIYQILQEQRIILLYEEYQKLKYENNGITKTFSGFCNV